MNVPEIHGIEIEGKIGQGGVATVWKGRQLTLDRPVAIKVLQAQWGDDPADVQRFQAEARSAAKLKHASIIQVHDANFAEGQYYIVMEYIDGYTVGDWLRRKGALSQKDALLIAECVADGLAYAWQHERIIHCDIKPDNVMVDRDGTVKIADLGLARTIDVLRPSSETDDEVMGTPAYMSPEQASGLSDLDCRADMYSLGCMLCHILTGKMPFEGDDVDTILDKQARGYLPDVMDVVRGVSKPMSALLEKMMAKDRALRQADWQEVLQDIQSVRHGCLPSRLPPPEASTMACSKRRMGRAVDAEAANLEKPWHALRKSTLLALAVITLGIGMAGMLAVVFRTGSEPPDPALAVSADEEEAAILDDTVARAASAAEAQQQYETALAWLHHNPMDFDGAIRELRAIASAYSDTEYAALARREMERIASLKRQEIERTVASLRQQAAEHIDRGDFTGAVAVVEGYDGMWAAETASLRRDLMSAVQQQQDERETAQRAAAAAQQQRVSEAWTDLCRVLLDDGCAAAVQSIARVLEDDILDDDNRIAFYEIQGILAEVASLHRRVLDSFYRERGQEVTVPLLSGTQQVVILDVDVAAETVIAEQPFMVRGHRAARSTRFSIHDLAPSEYAKRAGGEDDLAVTMVRILDTWSSADRPDLERRLAAFPAPFAEVMREELRRRRDTDRELSARTYLVEGLRRVGAVIDADGAYSDWAQALRIARASGKLHADAVPLASAFEQAFANTQVARDASGILEELRRPTVPADPQEGGDPLVAAAEHLGMNQPIVRAMVAANPDLFAEDVRIVRASGTGTAVRVEIVSSVLSSISPLGTIVGIAELVCAGVNPRHIWRNTPVAPLRDVSPLHGLPLAVLSINNTSVRDLTPLLDMPLLAFNASHTQVADITPLRNAPLEVVLLRGTAVRDISALRGKALTRVDLSQTAVFDFRPIAGGLLTHFEASGSQLRDLTVLLGSPIRRLNISGTGVFNFTPLRDLPLEHLELDKTQIRDLAVLREKALRYLSLRETPVTDISVLADMPLNSLYLSKTAVSDIAVLASLPLQDLDLSHTRIVDLTPLAQLPLRSLNLAGTRVRDLTPLSGLDLHTLNISNVPVESFAPLTGMPIERLSIDNPDRSHVRRVLRRMPNLRFVNGVEWIR